MRELNFGTPAGDFERWVQQALRLIELASNEDAQQVFKTYTVTGSFAETRTLDPATATAADIAAVLATIITDIQKTGSET